MSKEKWKRLQPYYKKMKLTERIRAKKLLSNGYDFYTLTVDGLVRTIKFYNENLIYSK